MLYAHTHKASLSRLNWFIPVLLTVILFYSCKNGHREMVQPKYLPDTSNLRLLKIDPSKLEEDPLGSSILDSVVYVPLETTNESMFSKINQLEVTEKYYIICDETTNSIFLFTKDGRFYSKISNSAEKAEDSYKKIDRFTLDEEKREIIFPDQHSSYIFYYSFDGKLLRKINKELTSEGYYQLSADNICLYRSTDEMLFGSGKARFINYSEAESSRIVIGNAKGIKKWYLPVDTKSIGPDDLYGVPQYFFNGHVGNIALTLPYDYNIYEIDSVGQIFNSYRFILPELNVLPNDFLNNDDYKGKRIKYLDRHKPLVYSITDFYKVSNWITFRLINGLDLHNYLLYNLTTKKLFSIGTITSDLLSFKLPLTEDRIFAAERGGAIISSITSASLFKAKLFLSGDEQWDRNLPPVLKKFFSGTNLQNPVLTLLYVKKNHNRS